MGQNYNVQSTRQTTEIVFGRVMDVREYTVETTPSGIFFVWRAPLDVDTFSVEQALIYQADYLEVDYNHPGVEAIEWFQDVNAANQIVDKLSVVVSSTSGLSTGILEVPFGQSDPRVLLPKVDALRAKLDGFEAM